MKRTILPAVLMSLTLLIGCTSTNTIVSSPVVTPITYQPEDGSVHRSVGLLRRLAILPAKIDFTPENPRQCFAESCDWDTLRRGLADSIVNYLSTWRGYEVTTLDSLVDSHSAVDLTAEELQDHVERLAKLAQQRSTDLPPEDFAQMVRDLGERTGADGIVIVHGSTTAFTWTEAALGLALAASGYGFLAAMPVEMARIGTKLEADVFEAATGRLVWTAVFSSSGNPMARAPAANEIAEKLFDPIEPALPAVFTRPKATAVTQAKEQTQEDAELEKVPVFGPAQDDGEEPSGPSD